MKRILIFSTAYLPMQGGAELAVKEITDRIGGYKFDLICARLKRGLPKTERIGKVDVHRVGFGYKIDKLLLPIFGFLKARRLKIENCKLEIVLWGIMVSWGSLAALIFKIFYPQTPFLLTLQEGDTEEYIKKGRFGLINFAWRRLLAKANYVQVISNYLADMAREYGYGGEIEVVPNGVDFKKFSISLNCEAIARKEATGWNFQFSNKDKIINLKNELNIKSSDRIIISVSRLVEKNGIRHLVDAIKLLITNYQSPIKLLILGSGSLENKLKTQVKNLKLEKSVLFLGDIPNEKVPQYLAIADVFARPSLSEGLGTAFLEAMACGVPIIGTRVGGIPDFLVERETGLFCEAKNPQNIAEKIKILLDDENLRQKLIANGRKLVEEKYDWNKIAVQMKDIFNKLL
jgi:glycosyltransferase involved in cell wall biosynthesis